MDFDETVHQVLDSLGDRLGAELRTAAEQMAAAVSTERGRLSDEARAVAEREAADRASVTVAEVQAQVRAAEARAHDEGFLRGRDAGRTRARADMRLAERAASERLLDGVRSIGRARSLSEVLDTLVSCAGREAPRAAVVLVRGDIFRSWRFIGFSAAFGAPGAIEIAAADAGVIAEAVRTGTVVSAGAAGLIAPPRFAALPPGRESVALPLVMSGQVVAVLYADQGADQGGEDGRAEASIPSPTRAWTGRLEVLARYAARCLETLTAFKAARALLPRPKAPAVGVQERQAARENKPDDKPDENRDAGGPIDAADAAARRYARLLVSEIKLYHEPSVIAGRRERDLATRLDAEIARARVLYEQRVPPDLPHRADYFHAELVRTLADGDATLLEANTST